MVAEKKLYRRVSVTAQDGVPVKYDARVDIEADPATGLVMYKVWSQVLTNKFVPFRGNGNAAEDAIYLEEVCQRVYEFDKGYRVRAVPKPSGTGAAVPASRVMCGKCGDYGWVEDDTGYQAVCECRSG